MRKKSLLATPYLIWSILFTIVPLLLIAYFAFTTPEGKFTFDNFIEAVKDKNNIKAAWLSIKLSFFCTLLCLIIAYPLAMILSKNDNGKKSIVIFFIVLPMFMNSLLRINACNNIMADNGIINSVLSFLGLKKADLFFTPFAVVYGMVYSFLPFMILPLFNVLSKMDTALLEASSDLGAGKLKTFLKVIFPLSLPGVMSGITMVFVPAITTFSISAILGGNGVQLIGNIIEKEIFSKQNVASALSLVLMIIILFSMAVFQKFDKDGEGSGLW